MLSPASARARTTLIASSTVRAHADVAGARAGDDSGAGVVEGLLGGSSAARRPGMHVGELLRADRRRELAGLPAFARRIGLAA